MMGVKWHLPIFIITNILKYVNDSNLLKFCYQYCDCHQLSDYYNGRCWQSKHLKLKTANFLHVKTDYWLNERILHNIPHEYLNKNWKLKELFNKITSGYKYLNCKNLNYNKIIIGALFNGIPAHMIVKKYESMDQYQRDYFFGEKFDFYWRDRVGFGIGNYTIDDRCLNKLSKGKLLMLRFPFTEDKRIYVKRTDVFNKLFLACSNIRYTISNNRRVSGYVYENKFNKKRYDNFFYGRKDEQTNDVWTLIEILHDVRRYSLKY